MPTASARTIPGGVRWAIPPLALLAVLSAVALAWVDSGWPAPRQWITIAVLGAVALLGAAAAARFSPPDEESTPPWSVHTIWLLPAALTTPLAAFAPLLALSVVLGLIRTKHSLATRLVVASITVLTTVEIRVAALLFDDVLIAGLVGIVALHLTGVLLALVAASAFTEPTGTALWLDYRWSFVQFGCSFAGLLVTTAMIFNPIAGLAALAPLLMAEFTLNWPELDRHARIDAKTGLPNARQWEDRSRDLISAASLRDVPVAVAMLDIDHFKAVNDSCGHLVGDEVLQGLAATLRSQVNPGDVLGRFGGEEFVITLFGLDHSAAQQVAERIRAAIAAQVHSSRARLETDPTRQDVLPRAATFSITCTIGLATSDIHGHHLIDLLSSADQALAVGKAAGRDRVQMMSADRDFPGGPAGGGPIAGGRDGTPDTPVGEAHTTPWAVAMHKGSWTHVAGQQRSTRLARRTSGEGDADRPA